ncbi:MAG TPA: Lpg1974 family pore-forming outer membrane protein [Thermoguttaceae bacterium]|nr:Lpg1974 family pore-forming outer membrane protein [Thermoguttaceae bacterium]
MLTGPRALALEFFGDVLYWRATDPVDWAMNTNASSTDQFVAFKTLDFDFATGFRVGVGLEGDWGVKLYYTRFFTDTEDTALGNVTPNFLGSRLFANAQTPPFYFEEGNIRSAIDYNVLDLDFGKWFCPSESWQWRPVLGLRGGCIHQKFDTEFRGTLSDDVQGDIASVEHIKNDFWGIGPKFGIENTLNLWRGRQCTVDLTMNFYTAYLLGFWTIHDVATNLDDEGVSTQVVPIDDRDFGALMFQAMIGLHLACRGWDVTVGYEFNDWLNQCQIFDDATGPHNNDLILQGLSARVGYRF